MDDPTDKTLDSFLAVWLLFHEVADEWIKELIAGGRAAGPEGPAAAELAARVADEKDRIRAMMAGLPGRPAGVESAGTAPEASRRADEADRRMAELEGRIVMLERDISALRGPKD